MTAPTPMLGTKYGVQIAPSDLQEECQIVRCYLGPFTEFLVPQRGQAPRPCPFHSDFADSTIPDASPAKP